MCVSPHSMECDLGSELVAGGCLQLLDQGLTAAGRAPFQLGRAYQQRATPGGHDQPKIAGGGQHGAWIGLVWAASDPGLYLATELGLQAFDQRLAGQKLEPLAAPAAHGARIQAHDPAVQGHGRLLPVKFKVVFGQQTGIGQPVDGLGAHP